MHVHTFLPSRENIGNPKIVGKLGNILQTLLQDSVGIV